jgi:hypothetical protein
MNYTANYINSLYTRISENIDDEVDTYLTESSNITYFELRTLFTMLYKTTSDITTKKVVSEILKSLSVREVRNIPMPKIKKLKSNSPLVFD